MSDIEKLLNAYWESCEHVALAFADVPPDLAVVRPIEGKWSLIELLCHLVETDLVTSMRIRALFMTEHPRLPGLSIEELTAIPVPEARVLSEELALFRLVRHETARIVRAMPSPVRARQLVLVKATGEEVTKDLSQLIHGITNHAHHHLEFVNEKRLALGLAASDIH